MFDIAIKAGITFIGVTTDDMVNLEDVLKYYAAPNHLRELNGLATKPWPYMYWTDNPEFVTPDQYSKFRVGEHQLICVNVGANPSVIDCGVLPTPPTMLASLLELRVGADAAVLAPLLKGLSLKSVEDVLRMTQARAGCHTPSEVRTTRMQMYGGVQGLVSMETDLDFYDSPAQLTHWMKVNKPFLFSPKVHPKLVPRGLLLDGSPGVGKSTAVKYLSREFGIPAYRLDIGSTLDKYIGVSEQRVAKILQQVDREEPCILLIDEVEKIFKTGDDSGVTQRILGQLLWWLAEHRSRVITIMTTNDRKSLPPELYRSGRVDEVIIIHRLSHEAARVFARSVYTSIMGTIPSEQTDSTIGQILVASGNVDHAHAEVAEAVYALIKGSGVPSLDKP